MKKLLFALLCIACTGTTWAQSPIPTDVPPQAPTLQLVHGRLFGGPACREANCPQVCVNPTKTICVAEPSTKKMTKNKYSSVCEKICYPKSTGLHLGGCKSDCTQGECANHAYTKKYLVKKVHTTECPTTKCVAVTVPACESGHGGILHGHRGAAAPGTIVETIPTPPMPLPKK